VVRLAGKPALRSQAWWPGSECKLHRLASPEPCVGRLSSTGPGRAELANPVVSAEVVREPVFHVILGADLSRSGLRGVTS